MAWSPFQRANAGIISVEQPGDYANPMPTTPATGPREQRLAVVGAEEGEAAQPLMEAIGMWSWSCPGLVDTLEV